MCGANVAENFRGRSLRCKSFKPYDGVRSFLFFWHNYIWDICAWIMIRLLEFHVEWGQCFVAITKKDVKRIVN